MTKRQNFGLQGGTGAKTRGDQSEKCDEKRVAHRDEYGLTDGRKLCVFRSDGVFGNHNEVWMGPYPYKFSGRTLNPVSWASEVEALKDRIQAGYGGEYNSVLLNHYRDGNDSVSWHADDEAEMDSQHPIASVSPGACREFKIRANDTRKIQTILLSSGSLLIMPAGFQQKYRHSLRKQTKAEERKAPAGERINLTFRRMLGK